MLEWGLPGIQQDGGLPGPHKKDPLPAPASEEPGLARTPTRCPVLLQPWGRSMVSWVQAGAHDSLRGTQLRSWTCSNPSVGPWGSQFRPWTPDLTP